MATAALDGVSLHFETDGQGPPMIVLHGGLGIDHQIYRRTLAPLRGDFHLVLPDQRGNGRSAPVGLGSLTMEQLAIDVLALADHLGLERFSLLGHSYGGFVAQELALGHGHRLDALILVDTTPGQLGAGEDPAEGQGPEPPPEVLAMMSTVPETDAAMADAMAQLFPAYFHRPGDLDLEAIAAGTIFRADAMVRGFEVLSSWSSVDRLASLYVPTLVMAGRHDVFTSYPQSQRIASRAPDASLVLFEHSGHFPWIEEPDRFFSTVREWHRDHARTR